MEPKTKQYLLVTVVGVTLFVALLRLSAVLAFAAKLIDLVLPILAGGILALFINVPMTGLEKRLKSLFRKAKKQPSAKAIHLLSFFITLLGVALVLVLALTLLIPELVQSFHSLYVQIEANIPRWTAYLSAQNTDMGWLMSWLEGINWEQLLHKITAGIDTVLVNAVGAVSATVNIVVTASFALIISIYMSLGTESLGHHARTLVCAYLKPDHAAGVLKFCRLFRQSFASFLTGQCSEAVILGVLMALAFSIFRIPYGSLVGVLTAICAIIPYVGALLSCVISVFLVLLVVATVFATWITPYGYDAPTDYANLYAKPSLAHPFGCDELGRDLLTRLLVGGRYSLMVALISVAIGIVAGMVIGALCGFFGKVVDNVLMRFMDIIMAIPGMMLAICVSVALGSGVWQTALAIAVGTIPIIARQLRGSTLLVNSQEYIEAARAIGASDKRIILKHILPNCMAPIIVQATLSIAGSILAIASLSFIGLGISPPTPEWGSMVSTGRQYFRAAWWVCAFPGFAIMLTILSLNLLGDGLRDALDPKLKN